MRPVLTSSKVTATMTEMEAAVPRLDPSTMFIFVVSQAVDVVPYLAFLTLDLP